MNVYRTFTLYSYSSCEPGSAAAGMQAGIGNVVAGSFFAGAQSVGAGGALPAIGYIVAGSVTSGVTGAVGWLRGRR